MVAFVKRNLKCQSGDGSGYMQNRGQVKRLPLLYSEASWGLSHERGGCRPLAAFQPSSKARPLLERSLLMMEWREDTLLEIRCSHRDVVLCLMEQVHVSWDFLDRAGVRVLT